MRRPIIALAVVIIAVAGLFLHYALPQVDVVRIVGADVKRVDTPRDTTATDTDSNMRTADVYFVLAETEAGSVRNYRNEDAFLYGKFDSSNLHTRTRSIAQNEDNLVAVRHYGWRIPMFSMFPNAVAIWEVEPGYRHLPIFNIVVLLALAGLLGYGTYRFRKVRRKLADQRAAREAERARRAEEIASRSDNARDRNEALEDFLGDGKSGKE